jgi:hypothetical protein
MSNCPSCLELKRPPSLCFFACGFWLFAITLQGDFFYMIVFKTPPQMQIFLKHER